MAEAQTKRSTRPRTRTVVLSASGIAGLGAIIAAILNAMPPTHGGLSRQLQEWEKADTAEMHARVNADARLESRLDSTQSALRFLVCREQYQAAPACDELLKGFRVFPQYRQEFRSER